MSVRRLRFFHDIEMSSKTIIYTCGHSYGEGNEQKEVDAECTECRLNAYSLVSDNEEPISEPCPEPVSQKTQSKTSRTKSMARTRECSAGLKPKVETDAVKAESVEAGREVSEAIENGDQAMLVNPSTVERWQCEVEDQVHREIEQASRAIEAETSVAEE